MAAKKGDSLDKRIRPYIAMKLRAFRRAKGLTCQDVGERLGLSKSTVSAWEVGRNQPDADTLINLCRLYGADISDFFPPDESGLGTESPNPSEALSKEEMTLLENYRALDEVGRNMLVSLSEDMRMSKRHAPKTES